MRKPGKKYDFQVTISELFKELKRTARIRAVGVGREERTTWRLLAEEVQ